MFALTLDSNARDNDLAAVDHLKASRLIRRELRALSSTDFLIRKLPPSSNGPISDSGPTFIDMGSTEGRGVQKRLYVTYYVFSSITFTYVDRWMCYNELLLRI